MPIAPQKIKAPVLHGGLEWSDATILSYLSIIIFLVIVYSSAVSL